MCTPYELETLQLADGLVAQCHLTGYDSSPVQVCILFRFLLVNCLSCFLDCDDQSRFELSQAEGLNELHSNISLSYVRLNLLDNGQSQPSQISPNYVQFSPNISLTEKNKCQPNPCRNGGTCTEMDDGFECSCPAEYKGPSCEGIRMRIQISSLFQQLVH